MSRSPSQPPPDAPFPPPPEGFREEWRADYDWRLAGEMEKLIRRCRRPGCCRPPVAALTRRGKRPQTYLYCDWHLYGRRIAGGRVEMRCLVPEEG